MGCDRGAQGSKRSVCGNFHVGISCVFGMHLK